MFKLLYVLGGAVLGAVITHNSTKVNTALTTAQMKTMKLIEHTKARFADMEI